MRLAGYDPEPSDSGVVRLPWGYLGGSSFTAGQRRHIARSYLRVIAHDGMRTDRPVYHGTTLQRFMDLQPGDRVDLPLTSAGDSLGMTRAFAGVQLFEGFDNDIARHAQGKPGVILEFEPGTAYALINSVTDSPLQEVLTAGRYRVVRRYARGDRDHVVLRQVEVFDPGGAGDLRPTDWAQQVSRQLPGSGEPWADTEMPVGELLDMLEEIGRGPHAYVPDPAEIRALAGDIRANGLREPLQVEETDAGLVFTDGGHRLRALQLLGWERAPVRRFANTPEGRRAANRRMFGG